MSEEHRILIHGGTVIDGNNIPGVRADVLVEGNRIAAIGRLDSVTDVKKIAEYIRGEMVGGTRADNKS